MNDQRRDGLKFKDIAVPGRTPEACSNRWYQLHPLSSRSSTHRTMGVRQFLKNVGVKAFDMPSQLLVDRDRRSDERDQLDTTGILMGDPPSSQSATVQARGAPLPIPDPYGGAPTL